MKAKTYWVKLASRSNWDVHLEATDAENAARKYIVRAKVPAEERVEVIEAVVFATPEKRSFLASDLAMTSQEAAQFVHDERPEEDARAGIAAVAVTTILLLIVLFVPSREGASPSSKLSLAAIALVWMGWGIREICRVRSRQKKEPNQQPEPTRGKAPRGSP